MKKSLTVGCVIMASGLSRRFGTNKLLADFGYDIPATGFAVNVDAVWRK